MGNVFAWLLRSAHPLGWGPRRLVGGICALTLVVSGWAGGAIPAAGTSSCTCAQHLLASPDGTSLDAYLNLTFAPNGR